jgi:hypothetical protein
LGKKLMTIAGVLAVTASLTACGANNAMNDGRYNSCLGCAAGGGFKLVSYVHSSVGHKKRNDIHRPETFPNAAPNQPSPNQVFGRPEEEED